MEISTDENLVCGTHMGSDFETKKVYSFYRILFKSDGLRRYSGLQVKLRVEWVIQKSLEVSSTNTEKNGGYHLKSD